MKEEESTFDVTMGAFDGAEVAEFVGLFILKKLSSIMNPDNFVLYREPYRVDGICAIKGTKRSVNDICKKTEGIFNTIGLKVEIAPTGPSKSVDFLDLNLDLSTGFHGPYRKPLNKPLFIHKDSNHPKTIKVEIPRNVCKRLSNNSSNEKILNNAKPPYEEALKISGHENVEIKFIPKENTGKHKKKTNQKKVLYCNLPWNMALKTNIGKEFLFLVDIFKNTGCVICI